MFLTVASLHYAFRNPESVVAVTKDEQTSIAYSLAATLQSSTATKIAQGSIN